jgi:hypothetical protein
MTAISAAARLAPRRWGHGLSRLAAGLAALLAAAGAVAQDLAPPPGELREVFERYTEREGIDPDTCTFGVWDRNLAGYTLRDVASNAFARCPTGPGARVCTRLAGELGGRLPVEEGCIAGFDTVAFSPFAALSQRGGFFIIIHEAKDRPLKLSQQLTLGFGPERDFCEMSARLLDAEGEILADGRYHAFTDLLADETLCRRARQ